MTIVDTNTAPWLPLRAHTRRDAFPLFCLPHAGGGASAFRTWLDRMPGVAVLPVQPPGREARFRDTPYERMAPLVADLATLVDEVAGSCPYAVYGHSLGALVAFELIREIGRRGTERPVHLFVSGCAAPHCPPADEPVVTRMARVEVVRMLRRLGGTPDWLLEDPNLLDLILPAVRSDFAIKESYGYVSGSPLTVPVTVVSSTEDKAAPHDLQARWVELTTGQFRLYTLTGGHFAVFEQANLTHAYLADALRAWL